MTSTSKSIAGLTTAEAKQLQEQYGLNELTPQKKENLLRKILHIICEPMFLLLLVAAAIYFLLGEPRDGIIMLVFVVGIISIDAIQEWKTDKTLNALKDLSAPHITVIRDGMEQTIASVDLVPGDLMLICEGVKIPADGVVVKCADLCVDESSLTGEAEGVWKVPEVSAEPSGDYWRKDYCYAGTLVTQGTATVRVDQIGENTEYGKIGQGVAASREEPTPLQRQTGNLVKTCAVIAGILFVLVGIFTWLNIPDHGFSDRLVESILSGVTLAMAMIPEEFPVILTVFLSMGAWRLAKKHSLVRKLPSVETLGAVSVLCVDKTGTITMNQMAVQELWAADCDECALVETMGLGCETDTYDPMEKAMLACCGRYGITREALFENELITEYAFTNELKMMGHVWRRPEGIVIAAKGSPERIFTVCNLTDEQRAEAEQKNTELSRQGLRVIAIATAKPESEAGIPASITDCSLTLLGLVGLTDPPRAGVKEDIAVCNRAGIRVVMITGDNGTTASAIAKEIGISNNNHIITGDQLNDMTDEELREAVRSVSIFSRVIPEHKMRIVRALKENGEIVAMTGDGVNDAPSIKRADIGVGMGITGTDVTKNVADMVLADDNFATIIGACEEGRRIYDNIRKVIQFLLSANLAEVFSVFIATLIGFTIFQPVQLLWVNLVTDCFPALALGMEDAEGDIMKRKPRNAKDGVFAGHMGLDCVVQGLIITALVLASFFVGVYFDMGYIHIADMIAGNADEEGVMMAFITLNMVEIFHCFNMRSRRASLFTMKKQNKWLWASAALALVLTVIVTVQPTLAEMFFGPVTLELKGVLAALGLAFLIIPLMEIYKAIMRAVEKE